MAASNGKLTKDFVSGFNALCVEYNIYPIGQLRILPNRNPDTFSIKALDVVNCGGGIKDTYGPFLDFQCEPYEILYEVPKGRAAYVQSDYMPGGAGRSLKSMADGKQYDSKSAYRKSLKANGYVEVGDQAPTEASKEIRGDHDCRKELKEALQRHL